MSKTFALIALLIVSPFCFSQINQSLEQEITISLNDISLRDAFKLLEQKGVSIAYNNFDELDKNININYTKKTIRYILNDLTKKNGLKFKLIGNIITIYKKKEVKNTIISGYVFDAESGEAMIGCRLFEETSRNGIHTNQFGFFSLALKTLTPDCKLEISYVGYETRTINFACRDTSFEIHLERKKDNLTTVIVTAKKDKIESTGMGNINLTSREIKAIPAIGGETDLLKAITLLPGIKQGVDGSSGFYVRGGGADQNLILLDGVPIYNPYHLWGFLSSFNSDAINDIEINKGAFPARYGGRLSSVLDITMRDGNMKKWEKNLTLGLLSAKLSFNGPLIKDKSSIMLTIRRTYADLIIVPINSLVNRGEGFKRNEGYNFTDLNFKFNYILSKKDRLYASVFLSGDKYYLNQSEELKNGGVDLKNTLKRKQGWGNKIGALRWNHLFGNQLFVNTTGYISAYNYYTDEYGKSIGSDGISTIEKESSIDYSSDVIDWAIKQDYQYYPTRKHTIRFGLSWIYHTFKPGVNGFLSKTGTETIQNNISNPTIYASELSAYIEDDFELTKRIQLNLGVHTSAFLLKNTTYKSIQPRAGVNFKISEKVALKFGYADMTQYLHLLTSSGISQSSDLWVPVTDNVKPQNSRQFSIGTAVNFNKEYQLEVEGYYKKMNNLIDYKNGASFLNTATNWEDKIEVGKGESYGAEIFIKKIKGKLTGWLGYTLAWSNRTFKEINFGETYPYRYDRRHDISLLANYKLSEKWSLNGSWVFYTGNAVTLPTSNYITPQYTSEVFQTSNFPTPTSFNYLYSSAGIIQSANSRNNYRLPAYHRLDLTATHTKKKSWGKWEMTFGVTNLYNRLNPSFYFIRSTVDPTTEKATVKYYQRTLFPIMPTFSYSISF